MVSEKAKYNEQGPFQKGTIKAARHSGECYLGGGGEKGPLSIWRRQPNHGL